MSQDVLEPIEQFEALLRKHHRYQPEAYSFVFDALQWTLTNIVCCDGETENKHVSGRDLLEGIRQFAIERFGPLASMVFYQWGVAQPEDWGEIVFHLIDHDLLGKQESDRKEDFKAEYKFQDVFNLEPELHFNKRNGKWDVTYRLTDEMLDKTAGGMKRSIANDHFPPF